MQSSAVLILLALLVAPAAATEVSPIDKVLQLLSDLQAKVISEGESAQKTYAKYAEWCEDRSKELGYEVKTGKAEAETLQATIAEETALSAALDTKIEELAASIASDEADVKAATEIRGKESADFAAEEKELMEVIDMLERATGILEREMAKAVPSSLLQSKNVNSLADALAVMVQASLIGEADASMLTSFVQAQQGSEELGAPAASVYEGQGGNILDTLAGLSEKAETQLAQARKTETSNKHNFEMLEQSLTDEIKFATKDMDEAKKSLAGSSEKKATAEGDLEVTSKDLSEDVKAKAELHQECMAKAEDFEAETKSRGEELKALAEAKKVIAETSGGAEGIVYSQVSLLQTQSASRAQLAGIEVVRKVRDLARKHHAPALAQLAQRLDALAHAGGGSADVFTKIKGLISDMIAKLEAQAGADATHKAYCDKEMSDTVAKKEEKEAEVKKLTTKIDQMSADSAQLKEEITELQAAIAALTKSQVNMDQIRAEEKEAYTQNKADMELGIEGVKKALAVLTAYYAKDKAHSAAEGAGEGIIGLLEVVESDFSKELAEIESTEETAASAYEAQTKENEVELTVKSQDVKYKTKESKGLDKSATELSADRSTVQDELDAVLEYYAKIKEQCIAKAEPYAARKARREAEIAGLKEALTILEEETAFVQKRSVRRTLRGAARQHVLA